MVSFKAVMLGMMAAVATARNSAVIDLIPSNFDDVVLKSGKPTLVEFFAPWCGHCKNLAPVWEELALTFEKNKDQIQIAKVDADAEKSLGKRFGVQGFPTLKYFDGKSETPEDYKSGRDLESLTDFIVKKTGIKPKKAQKPASDVVMLSDSTFKTEIGGDKAALVAFTAPWCGHCKTLAPIWEELAHTFANEDGVLIAKVDAEADNSKATAQDQGVTSYPTIKFFPAGSKEPVEYSSGRSEQAFIDFINEKVGTNRTPGGGLNIYAGTIAALDAVVTKFTGGVTVAEALAEAQKEAGALTEQAQLKYAEYYVRVFNKLNDNNDWASKELARLDGILTKGGLAPAKRDEITSKTNILRKFVAKVGETVESIKDEL